MALVEPHDQVETRAHSQQQYRDPIPTNAKKRVIQNYAEKLRQDLNFSDGFQLKELVRNNSGEIQYFGFENANQPDSIHVEPDDSFIIWLSAHTSEIRDNFTIAHELGHYLLHWPIVKRETGGQIGMRATRRVDRNNNELMRCEWEANWFAASFLMPEEAFKRVYPRGNANLHFGVSQSAVDVRAKALGLR